MMYEGLPQ